MFPDKRVAMAIMQAYLQTKETGWINWLKGWQLKYDEETKQITPPNPETAAGKKFAACINILKQIAESDNKLSRWEEILRTAHEAAENERKEAWKTSSTGLAETLDALRDYVLSELMEFESFKTRRQGLFDDQTRLNLDIKTREENKAQYDPKESEALRKQLTDKLKDTQPLVSPDDKNNREAFFNAWIKSSETSKALEEKSFNDFVKNIKDGKHKLDLCDAALGVKEPQVQEAKTVTTPRLSEMRGTLLSRPKPQNRQEKSTSSSNNTRKKSSRRGLTQESEDSGHHYDTRSRNNNTTRRYK